MIVDTVPLLDGSPEVWHCPELAIGSSCGITKQVGGSIKVQPGLELLNLYRRKPGPIATTPLVGQSGYANSKILAAPFHESRSTAPGDFHYLLAGVAGAVQADCLVAGTGRTIFTVGVSIGEFLDLLLGQLESSSCHTPIVWLLIDLSIRCGY